MYIQINATSISILFAGSKREGSGSSAHLVSTGPESSLDLGSMTGQEGGQSREESSWVDLGHSSEVSRQSYP